MTALIKSLARLAAIVVGCVVVAGAVWFVVIPYWPVVLLVGYLVVSGTILLQILAVSFSRRAPLQAWNVELQLAAGQIEARHRFLGRIRNLLENPLRMFMSSLLWPYFTVITLFNRQLRIERPTPTRIQSIHEKHFQFGLLPVDSHFAVTTLALVLITYGIVILAGQSTTPARIFLWILFLGTVLRHLAYSFSLVPLPMRLRRSLANSYVWFVVLVVADAVTLTLTIGALQQPSPEAWTSRASLAATGQALFRFDDFFRQMAAQRVLTEASPLTLLIPTSGFLFYGTCVRTLLRFREFRRIDEDYTYVGQSFCVIGRFNDALEWIGNVQEPTVPSEWTKAAAYLGVNEVDRALTAVRGILGIEGYEPTPDRAFLRLATVFEAIRLPSTTLTSVIARAIQAGVSDVSVYLITHTIGSSATKPGDVFKLFENDGIRSNYKLTRAHLLIAQERFDEARQELQTAELRSALETVVWACLALFAGLVNPKTTRDEDRQFFEDWCERHLHQIKDSVRNLASEHERVSAFGQLHQVMVFAEMFQSPRAEEMRFIVGELRAGLGAKSRMPRTLQVMDVLRQRYFGE